MTSIRPSSRDAVIESAFDVLSREPGASLSVIAERAGVGRATLHRHFDGRDDLVRTLARIAIEEMDAAAEEACAGVESHGDALRETLFALIPLGDRHGFLAHEPMEDDPDMMAAFKRQQAESLALAKAAQEEGLFEANVPVSWIVQAYDHLLYAGWESVRTGEATPRQAAELAWTTLTRGLGAKSS